MSAKIVRNRINPIVYLLETYPYADWDMAGLSSHPLITLDYMLSRPNLMWNWQFAQMNPNIAPEYIVDHPEIFGTHYDMLALNINLTADFVLNHEEIDWDWLVLSSRPNIVDKEFLDNHPELFEFHSAISANSNFTPEDIVSTYNHFNHIHLSYNPNITIKFVLDHPEIVWDWMQLSANPGIFPKDIINHRELPWVLSEFTMNPNLTFDNININSGVPWNQNLVYANPNLAIENIKFNNSNFYTISGNPMIRIPAQKLISRTWRAYRKRKAQSIYLLQMSLKRINIYLPELVIRTIYDRL